MLGNNAANLEGMVGEIFRVTTYDRELTAIDIARHGSAFTGEPPEVITKFTMFRMGLDAGLPVELQWEARVGDSWSISPNVGDVTALTTNGVGRVTVFPTENTTYTLNVTSPFGIQMRSSK